MAKPRAKKSMNRPDLEASGDMKSKRVAGTHWWAMDGGDPGDPKLAQEVTGLKSLLVENQMNRQRDLALYHLMYLGYDVEAYMAGVGIPMANMGSAASALNLGPMLNITKVVCDTVVSRIATDKPKPFFLTSKGKWSEQMKAKKLQTLCDGLFYEWKYHQRAPRVALDACIWDTGAFKIFEENKRVKIERTLTPELLVDDGEGIYGEPQQMLQRKYVARDKLTSLFSDFEAEIARASISTADISQSKSVCDLIEVTEAWKLPSLPGEDDGRHCIAIENCTLVMDEWKNDYFPFAFLNFDKRQLGFWGQGICEAGRSIQFEINRTMKRIANTLRRVSVNRVYLERGSKIVKSQISNMIGQMIEYNGRPPIIDNSNTVAPELFEHLQQQIAFYFQTSRQSQTMAQGEKPADADSSVAMRTADDIESAGRQVFADAYQQLPIDVMVQAFDRIREIYERDGKFTVTTPGKKWLDKQDWGEIDLKADEFAMRPWPVNLLPDTPGGKIKTLTELAQNGIIQGDVIPDLLDFPDIKAAMGPREAPLELIKFQIEKMLEHGESIQLEPYQDPAQAAQLANWCIQEAETMGCPEEHLARARDYLTQAEARIPAPMPPPGPPAGTPPAMLGKPQQPPPAGMLPFVQH